MKRHRRIAARIVAGCALMVGACVALDTWLCSIFFSRKAEFLLQSAQDDLHETARDCMTRVLSFLGHAVADNVGTVRPYPKDEMVRLMNVYRLDELNFADTNGVWVASSEDGVVGDRLDSDPNTLQFMDVLKPGVHYVHQPFRSAVHNPNVCRMYMGVAFGDGSGLVQIGYDYSRISERFDRHFPNFLQSWQTGDGHYYILADSKGVITDSGRTELLGRTLKDIGFEVPLDGSVPKDRTFRMVLAGEKTYCRLNTSFGHHFITVLPYDAFDDLRKLVLSITMFVVFLFVSAGSFVWVTSRRQRNAREALRRAEEKRQREDLAMARSIQHSALPDVFPPYPRDLMMDIYAEMIPARDVGGDFYDFFYAGRDRLAFLVADVSGKGVPAALFMMKAKMTLRALILSHSDLAEAVAEANERLCEGNVADMFVTCWVGVLDETSGTLTYVNAGHNPPYLQSGAPNSRPVPLDSVSGMFLGAMPGIRYKVFTAQLHPGDLLFLYTDGVTEANNSLGGMFGEERLEEVLTGARGKGLARFSVRSSDGAGTPPDVICTRVRNAVDAFAGKAAQFDDITTLGLRYRGLPKRWEMLQPADLASVPALSAFAEEKLVEMGCPQDVKADILVALDEVANNVAQYSGSPVMTLEIEIACDPKVARLRIVDIGTPWNPLEHLDPDTTLSADERTIGGLGILMVKKLMDDVAYVRHENRNVFSFRKAFGR